MPAAKSPKDSSGGSAAIEYVIVEKEVITEVEKVVYLETEIVERPAPGGQTSQNPDGAISNTDGGEGDVQGSSSQGTAQSKPITGDEETRTKGEYADVIYKLLLLLFAFVLIALIVWAFSRESGDEQME